MRNRKGRGDPLMVGLECNLGKSLSQFRNMSEACQKVEMLAEVGQKKPVDF